MEKNSVSFNSLLHLVQLLKVGLRLKIMVMMRELLLGWQNLMFPFVLSKPIAKIFSIGRSIDVFLTLVARDENLGAKNFQSLAEALPKDARYSDDNLNRAIDMYPKVQKFIHS